MAARSRRLVGFFGAGSFGSLAGVIAVSAALEVRGARKKGLPGFLS